MENSSGAEVVKHGMYGISAPVLKRWKMQEEK